MSRRLKAFKMVDKGIPRHNYEVCDAEGNKIGVVTSGTMSPMLNQGIGMAYINSTYTKLGTEIYIRVRKKLLKAEIVKIPFYKG